MLIFEVPFCYGDTIIVESNTNSSNNQDDIDIDVYEYNEEGQDSSKITLTKDEAIKMARSILEHFGEK